MVLKETLDCILYLFQNKSSFLSKMQHNKIILIIKNIQWLEQWSSLQEAVGQSPVSVRKVMNIRTVRHD